MSEVDAIFDKVRGLFTYVSDKEKFDAMEQWDHYADEVERGESFTGDCDAFAVTCAELLHRKGFDPRLIYCKTETGGGHLVCGVDTDNDTRILDNRQRWVVSASELPAYEFIKGMRYSEPGVWRIINVT